MAAEAKEVVEGGSSSESMDLSGFPRKVRKSATKVYHVKGLEGKGDARKEQAKRLVPFSLGSSHPTIPGAVCVGKDAEIIGGGGYVIVTLRFETGDIELQGGGDSPNNTRVSIGAGLKQVTTERDRAGNNSVRYKAGARADPGEVSTAEEGILAQGFQAQVTQALHTIHRARVVQATQTQVETYARDNTNTISSDRWHGAKPFQWKCTGITAESEDQKNWSMREDFEYDEEYHNPVVTYIDPQTGKPPGDITEPKPVGKPGARGNGTLRLDWYRQKAFGKVFRGL